MIRLFLIVFSSTPFLLACSSPTGPVNIRDTNPSSQLNDNEGLNIARLQPVVPDKQEQSSIPIVKQFIDRANDALASGQADRAIEFAERGLRIDRKESRLYLVLAEAYRSKANNKQSRYFAKQGLRYAKRSGSTYRKLLHLSR